MTNIDVAGTAKSSEPQPDAADPETRPAKTGKHLWGHTRGFAGSTGQDCGMPNDDVLPIVMCGDPVLRHPAQSIDPSDLAKPAMRRLIAQMRATMEAAPGVGLAAPQVGVSLRLAVLQDGPERWGQQRADELAMRERTPLPFTVMVNPVVSPVEDGGDATFYEGCLSVPGLTGVVKRHRSVTVRGLDERGKAFSREYRGWPARIAQHELDHLAGILYLDRVETRSVATADNYAKYWAGPARKAAQALGFQV
jgi:peptide deformylase